MSEAVNQRFDCTYLYDSRVWILSIAYHQFYTVVRIANYTLCWKIWFAFALKYVYGSDCFTENFQVKENKTKMRNTHPRFFHLLF